MEPKYELLEEVEVICDCQYKGRFGQVIGKDEFGYYCVRFYSNPETDLWFDEYEIQSIREKSTDDSSILSDDITSYVFDSNFKNTDVNKELKCESAKKFDNGKLQWSLLPKDSLEEAIKVLEYGLSKYGKENWKGGMTWSRLFNATQRHLWKWNDKKDLDEETELSHIAHAITNLLFLMYYIKNNLGEDDR